MEPVYYAEIMTPADCIRWGAPPDGAIRARRHARRESHPNQLTPRSAARGPCSPAMWRRARQRLHSAGIAAGLPPPPPPPPQTSKPSNHTPQPQTPIPNQTPQPQPPNPQTPQPPQCHLQRAGQEEGPRHRGPPKAGDSHLHRAGGRGGGRRARRALPPLQRPPTPYPFPASLSSLATTKRTQPARAPHPSVHTKTHPTAPKRPLPNTQKRTQPRPNAPFQTHSNAPNPVPTPPFRHTNPPPPKFNLTLANRP